MCTHTRQPMINLIITKRNTMPGRPVSSQPLSAASVVSLVPMVSNEVRSNEIVRTRGSADEVDRIRGPADEVDWIKGSADEVDRLRGPADEVDWIRGSADEVDGIRGVTDSVSLVSFVLATFSVNIGLY